MTADLISEIRAALAANAEGDCAQAETAYNALAANAPTWLALLCDEIERLRHSAVVVQSVRESELLAVINERNAATADLKTQAESWAKDIQTARAWRACAEQLASWIDPLGPLGTAAAYERLKAGNERKAP